METWQIFTYLIGLVIAIYIIVDAWRSNASTGAKIGWTIGALFCNLLTLILWLVWGRKNAYEGS
ncbi:PLDc_N domain-containing protein [Nocardioides sp. GY 10113]|uniref:PLD nuclease N-terminal domain-containing protein n=1 Tax=Nocardioides sp. GY 10113 TaxID=2569761 RepID=UPI0010A89F5D|nr:PLD nuclease N-terminal domain-containing protein [Nocardioides sp. GY 10113]TIC87724.1 PLDc_N domain-containing protein [Nocardioides sp. GY 10113]